MIYEIKYTDLTIKNIEKIYNSKDIKYNLYSIPMYGGELQLECKDSNAQVILSALDSLC